MHGRLTWQLLFETCFEAREEKEVKAYSQPCNIGLPKDAQTKCIMAETGSSEGVALFRRDDENDNVDVSAVDLPAQASSGEYCQILKDASESNLSKKL